MKKTFFGLFAIMLLFGLASLGSSEIQVSLNNVNMDLPKIEVDIHLANGKGVAGYSLMIAYDPAVLKYIDTTQGDYLTTGGIFLRPALGADDTYELQLTIDDTTMTGQSVVYGEGEEAQPLVLSEFFFKVPDPTESGLLPGGNNDVWVTEPIPGTDTDVGVSDLKYQAVNVVSVAPLTATGNGTLASMSFDVINPDVPMVVHLVEINLFGADDNELNAKLHNNVATFKKLASDVNVDGVVNILDLTRVAVVFGEPVSDNTAAADVNADSEINILDLVQVSQDFGQSAVSVVYTTVLLVDTVEETDVEPGSISNIGAVDPPEPEPEPMSVGLVLPLSGHLAEIGEIMATGFELAAGELKDTIGIRYTIADDQGTAEGAVAAFEKLIHDDGVSVILGPGSSSSARAAFPIAQENEVVAISATAGASGLGAIGDFIYRVALTTDIVIPKAVEITKRKMGYQRVATLYDKTDLFSTDRDAALQQAFLDKAVEVLGTQTYITGTTDFTSQLRHIKALNPDALFVSALPPEKPAILIQARELGIDVPILISSLTQVEVEAAGAAAEGALTFTGWLSTDETPGNLAFVERYRSTYGTTPNAFAAVSYACVHIFAEALKNAPDTDAHSIRDALANITDLDTILGKFAFNADGDAVYIPNILIVKNGTLQFFN
jgi:branched-chain amino acid transport system substrate-binding protein